MEDFNDLAFFAAVVTHGSFSGAARTLGVPKSRVSRRIAELERRLGVRLLQRSTRAMRVTDVGAAFFAHCETMTNAAKAALEVAERAGERPSGRVRVSSPAGVAHLFLAPLLPRFLCAHPDVRLELELTNRRVDVIGEGFDVAMRIRTALDDSDLVVRTFGVSDQVLVASPGFVASHGPFAGIDTLRGKAGLGAGGRNGEAPRWQLTAPDGQSVEIDYAPALVTDDVELLTTAAIGGAGIAMVPFNACRQAIGQGQLQQLFPAYAAATHQLHAVYASRRGLLPAVRAFIEFLAAELPQTMQQQRLLVK
ncbi:LysR family transcriptional regulator [Duganella radicis]|uniref:LysR family transcriptional regulator n=1 Tax=Duganella radicis TaxID=551988 RepID=A0A6L6PJI4_9BURK|nr:LysR family transcriptional regulator [Duganella radicis]MTV39102.1 LysR family transcriptional regulator [Duganella radicis]